MDKSMQAKRRFVLKGAALTALVFTIDGADVALSPRAARAADVPMQILTPREHATLEAFADIILPGARAAGVAAYVDHQLAGDPGDALLIARILNVPPPYAPFYRNGLAGLDKAALAAANQPFADLPQAAQVALAKRMQRGAPPGWEGPPAPFFYAVSRHDAVDVFYGTVEGFERLNIPYLAHIQPTVRW
jgi:hypothetical protein